MHVSRTHRKPRTDFIAIPHAQTASIHHPGLVVARFDGPIEWETLDDQPIRMAIALLVPVEKGGTTHLRLLSGIARSLMDDSVRRDLLAAEDPAAVVDLLSSTLDL
ncbi:PTS sugar transporter subunit IIA [Rathayibacter sp. VKM Ac-2760]|uniref:PTS sugar transporter subunit IIA n=1 Tax=Rathayibacter sp. VKM Ac-2760 TaxID=2609253 RepID=UPI0013177E7A|nr:PTS sugar transporter subunit IIA [Rathayibacter sp. VKM Ac-2760]QHC58722.1 PTS transporter subunit EIIA [Rathayibacter sp. VKM Ac-2760]